jgi:hypothetical protein
MMSDVETQLRAENDRLRNALARISLAEQRTDSPAHVILARVGCDARAALKNEND